MKEGYSANEKINSDNSTTVIQYKWTRANKSNSESMDDKVSTIIVSEDTFPTKSYSESFTGGAFLPTAIPTIFEAVPTSTTSTITTTTSTTTTTSHPDFQPTSHSITDLSYNNAYEESSSVDFTTPTKLDLIANNTNTIQSKYDFSYPVVQVSLNLTNKQRIAPNLQNNMKPKIEDLPVIKSLENVSIFEAFPTTGTFESTRMSVKNASVDDDEDSDWSIPILEPTRISKISTVQEDEFLSYDPTFEPFRSKSDKNGSFIPSSDKHKVRTFQSSSDKNGPFQKSPLVKNGDKERNPIFKPFQQSNLNKNLPVLTNSDKNQDSERHLTNVEIIENDETDVEPEPEFVDPTQISISEVTSQLISENIELFGNIFFKQFEV